jgi:CRP/FNR family cyclic AMP-dependent transcriptional regulator
MATQDYAAFLGEVDLFSGLTREELKGLDNITEELNFEANQEVINQGGDDRDVYLVMKGTAEVEIELQLDEQKSKHLATFKEGDFFGEVALVDKEPRSATVRAGEAGLTCLRISFNKLETIMDRNHHIGYVIIKHIAVALCERIRATNVQVRDTFTWGRF